MNTLPSCTTVPPILKFARWKSIKTSWMFYREEMWGLKEVLEAMRNTQGEALQESIVPHTAHMNEKLHDSTKSGKGKLLSNVPDYITQDLIDSMDMFCAATYVLDKDYEYRSSQVKGPKKSLKLNLELTKGAWDRTITDTIRHVFHTPETVMIFDGSSQTDRAKNNGMRPTCHQ